jgi:hypothetical protein
MILLRDRIVKTLRPHRDVFAGKEKPFPIDRLLRIFYSKKAIVWRI